MGALKGDGLKVGTPDLLCVWNRGVAFLEVKRPGGKLSPAQEAVHEALGGLGWPVAIVTSPDEALAALEARGAPVRAIAG